MADYGGKGEEGRIEVAAQRKKKVVIKKYLHICIKKWDSGSGSSRSTARRGAMDRRERRLYNETRGGKTLAKS